jgi:hypothetical protein
LYLPLVGEDPLELRTVVEQVGATASGAGADAGQAQEATPRPTSCLTARCLLLPAANGVAWGYGGEGLGMWGRRRGGGRARRGGGGGMEAAPAGERATQIGKRGKRVGPEKPKSVCHASPPGVTSLSCQSRWRDRAGPAVHHATSGQTPLPPLRPLSRHCMWHDSVVMSRHAPWRD